MHENITNTPEPKREYNPCHVSLYGLRVVETDGQLVQIHDTNNLKELYEAYWRQGLEDMPESHNPVQEAYLHELTATGDGLRMLRVLDSLRQNKKYEQLLEKLDQIAKLRYRIQEAKAHGQETSTDYLERELWEYYHSKLFDILVPEIQRLDSSLDPNWFCR